MTSPITRRDAASRAAHPRDDGSGRYGRSVRAFACAGALVAVCSAAASAGGRAIAPCTFANGYQSGPSSAGTAAGNVISLHVENTRGRADCRFRATLALSLLGANTRVLLPVRGNPARPRNVDRIVLKGTVLRISWLWRNWCRRPLTAVGDLAKGRAAVTQRWVSLFRSPACANRRRPSTLAASGLSVLR